jgi:hypothetical protein
MKCAQNEFRVKSARNETKKKVGVTHQFEAEVEMTDKLECGDNAATVK